MLSYIISYYPVDIILIIIIIIIIIITMPSVCKCCAHRKPRRQCTAHVTLAGKARSLLQDISGVFSRSPLDRIQCHGAHDKARNLADRASGSGRSSEFFAGWPKFLDGQTGPFWVSSFVYGGFSDSSSDSGGGGRAVLVLSLLLALLTVGVLKCWPSLSSWDTVALRLCWTCKLSTLAFCTL